MKLTIINIPYVFNKTIENLPPVLSPIGTPDPLATHPAARWLTRLSAFFNKALEGNLIIAESPERKTAYEEKHSVTLNDYPVELLQFEHAYLSTIKTAGQHTLQYSQLRALSDVLTDEAFLTSLDAGFDLDTPYVDVLLAIQTTTPPAYFPTIEYSGGPQLQYKLGLFDGSFQFLQIIVDADEEVTGRTLLDYTEQTTLIDTTGSAVNALVSSTVPYNQQVRYMYSIDRWVGFINQLSTPVEVPTAQDVNIDKWAPLETPLGSIFQSFKLPDGTLIASYPTNYVRKVMDQPSYRASLVLHFTPSHELYISTSRMDETFVTDFFPAFLSTDSYNAEIGGYLISAKDMPTAERQFERFVERKPGIVPLLNGGW